MHPSLTLLFITMDIWFRERNQLRIVIQKEFSSFYYFFESADGAVTHQYVFPMVIKKDLGEREFPGMFCQSDENFILEKNFILLIYDDIPNALL